MKKNVIVILMTIVGCGMLTSCELVEKVYPILDYVAVDKNSQDIYARNDAYAPGDTMCLDTALVANFVGKKNISSKYQYTLAKPKVEWQRQNLDWMLSKGGKHMRWMLFYVLVTLGIVGIWAPLLYVKFKEKMENKQINSLEKKAEKAINKEKFEQADAIYAKLEKLQASSSRFSELSHWTNRIIPYSLLALTLVEGLYLFLFNFNMPMLSPSRIGLWNSVVNIALLALVMISQGIAMYIYSDMLSARNNSESRWWSLPIKWLLVIAVLVMILKNIFVMPLEIIALILGAISMIYIMTKNKLQPSIDVKVYAVTLFLMSYIYMYFISYTLLIILTIVIVIAALFLCFKSVGASVQFSNDNSRIRERMQRNPTLTYDEASRQYYAERRAEMKQAMEAKKMKFD